jgi:hypothetical protein
MNIAKRWRNSGKHLGKWGEELKIRLRNVFSRKMF